MNKTLVITTIALVAVVMGFSTIAPVLQQAFAHDVTEPRGRTGLGGCPEDFQLVPITKGQHPDHNFNGSVCLKSVSPCDACRGTPIFIDDSLPPI